MLTEICNFVNRCLIRANVIIFGKKGIRRGKFRRKELIPVSLYILPNLLHARHVISVLMKERLDTP